jgi:hypothetical protein
MAFPTITLPSDYIAQTEYKSATVQTIQIDDNTEQKNLRTFVQLGDNPSFKYWITVMSGDDYTVDWTNDQVTAAVQAFFASNNA